MSQQRILFLTGKLAEPALRRVVADLNDQADIAGTVQVLGISVAALMHTDWIRRQLAHADLSAFDRVLLPGWCQGDLESLSAGFGRPFERGPKDLYDLPVFFGRSEREDVDLSDYDIDVIAEINHSPRLSEEEILRIAAAWRQCGADVIDLGCIPGEVWPRAGEVTRLLRQEGLRVSIDSFEREEVEAAVAAGAELVLSCHSGNRDWATTLDAELVLIPDDPRDLSTLEGTVAAAAEAGARFRIDPVLEPIGFGFAASLWRYFAARQKWPQCEMLMGIGNLTELTAVDTAGMNMLLAGLCQELSIRSVLTTQVINWARSAVAEFDIARRLVHYAARHQVLPKHLDDRLVMLRDPQVRQRGPEAIEELSQRITDPNFRVLVDGGEIHVLHRDGHWHGEDPYALFDEFTRHCEPLDASHAFYLGYELCKARTALTLGKHYVQDEALRWGFLTVEETSARERRRAVRNSIDEQ